MTNPKTGWVNREWTVEQFANTAFAAGVALFSSARRGVVSEAYLINGQVGGTAIGFATVIAHDRQTPDQGTVGGTQAATLGPNQWKAGVYGLNGGTVGGSLITSSVWLIRGR